MLSTLLVTIFFLITCLKNPGICSKDSADFDEEDNVKYEYFITVHNEKINNFNFLLII